jgi:alpha-methylacyl-CoA racemase
MAGPLTGVRVIEIGGIGPGPFAGMILADLGAEVIRVDRPGGSMPVPLPPEKDLSNRGKRQVALDLKHPDALDALLQLIDTADLLIEGHRPGVAERLGFGPEVCLARKPALVYGRMTGWGQDGPWAKRAGHDVNYISATGVLHAIGPAGGAPQIPLNVVGDFGGGSTYLVIGMLAALMHARATGQGQVVDAAIVDGASHLLANTLHLVNSGMWQNARGVNVLDGGAPFYGVYETSDGRHFSVGAIEGQFWAQLLEKLGIAEAAGDRNDPRAWPALRAQLATAFASATFEHWREVFADSDACATPVVSFWEATEHPQLAARGSLTLQNGDLVPGVAPRLSATPGAAGATPTAPGTHTHEVLDSLGLNAAELIADGAAHQV